MTSPIVGSDLPAVAEIDLELKDFFVRNYKSESDSHLGSDLGQWSSSEDEEPPQPR